MFISKIDILDTSLVWGNSHEEIFGNILRLLRFGVYFERILNKKWLFSGRNNYIIVARICQWIQEHIMLASMRKF